MKIIQVDMVTYETNTDKAGKIYTDGTVYSYHTADGTSTCLDPEMVAELVKMTGTIDDLSTAAARLQGDLGAVKSRLLTAVKGRDKAEKTVETLQADLRGSLGREEVLKGKLLDLKILINTARKNKHAAMDELDASRGDLAQALDSIGVMEKQAINDAWRISEMGALPKVEPVSPANLAMLKEKYNVDDLLRLRAGGLV